MLTEFQAREALPVILDAFSLHDPVLDGIFADCVTEELPRTVAVLAGDQLELLEAMVLDQQLDDSVRWAVAGAIPRLVKEGKLPRGDAVERLMRLLRAARAADDDWAATIVVSELGDLNPLEVMDEIRAAFADGAVDESVIDLGCFDDWLLHPESPGSCPELENTRSAYVSDTVEELRRWYGFSQQALEDRRRYEQQTVQRERERAKRDDETADRWSAAPTYIPPADTIRKEAPHVGRNDPCPCGSGKKYKKCCLKTSIDW